MSTLFEKTNIKTSPMRGRLAELPPMMNVHPLNHFNYSFGPGQKCGFHATSHKCPSGSEK
jgi:hypothetical protein